jgi:D-3-phosphoglycerate dehydrogenase
VRSKLHVSTKWIDQAPKLKLIARPGSGLDNIDQAYAKSKGILCINAPEGNNNAVAEHTLGLMLSVLSNIHASASEVEQLHWDREANRGIELGDLTVGIIGFGFAGSKLAKVLTGLDCKVLAYDRFKKNIVTNDAEIVDLETIQNEADVVSFHPDLNETSLFMFNDDFVQNMKKPFYLFNASRGKVVRLESVIKGLDSGKILGCGLDVIENEKLKTLSTKEKEELADLSARRNVIITPHIAGITHQSFEKLSQVLGEKIIQWIKSHPIVN